MLSWQSTNANLVARPFHVFQRTWEKSWKPGWFSWCIGRGLQWRWLQFSNHLCYHGHSQQEVTEFAKDMAGFDTQLHSELKAQQPTITTPIKEEFWTIVHVLTVSHMYQMVCTCWAKLSKFGWRDMKLETQQHCAKLNDLEVQQALANSKNWKALSWTKNTN